MVPKYSGRRFQTALSLLLLCGMNLPAQAFDLPQAWQAAKDHSANYAAARHERDAEAERKYQARAALLPQITANASHQKQPTSLSSNTRSRGWNVQVSQTLFDKSRWAQYQQGKLAEQVADAKLDNSEAELLLNVAQAYFNVLLNQDKLAAIADEKIAYTQQLKQARTMFEKGAATVVDSLEAQAGYDAALAKEMAVLNQLHTAQNTLLDITGFDPREIQPLRRNTSIPDLLDNSKEADWQNLAVQYNPEWQLQKLATENARQGSMAAKGSHWPRLTLSGGYQNNLNTQQSFGREQQYRSKGGTLTLQLTVPLYSGGHTASQVREAAARELQNQQLLTATKRKVQLAVKQAYRNTHNQQYQIKAQQRLLETNQAKLEATALGRKVGVRSNLDELQAVQAKADAEQKLAEAKYGYVMAYLQLLNSAGVLGEEVRMQQIKAWLY